MKATILYDLSTDVELDTEDQELFSMFRHGEDKSVLTEKVVVQTSDGLYLIDRPAQKKWFFRFLSWLWVAFLIIAAVVALVTSLAVISLPGEVPFWATVAGAVVLGLFAILFEKINC